jgi:ElaB/YqjD/DUF883 family membrane-anchored ribosome-binding protein
MSAAMGNERTVGAGRLGQEFERAKDNISGAAASAKENLGDDLGNLRADIARLSETVTQLAKQVASEVGSVAEVGAGAAKEQVASMATEVENIVRRNPLGTLAGVFFVGLFIGMLRSR